MKCITWLGLGLGFDGVKGLRLGLGLDGVTGLGLGLGLGLDGEVHHRHAVLVGVEAAHHQRRAVGPTRAARPALSGGEPLRCLERDAHLWLGSGFRLGSG